MMEIKVIVKIIIHYKKKLIIITLQYEHDSA